MQCKVAAKCHLVTNMLLLSSEDVDHKIDQDEEVKEMEQSLYPSKLQKAKSGESSDW